MSIIRITTALLFTLTIQIQSEGCRVGCRIKGYDAGQAFKRGCQCIDIKESYHDFINGTQSLGPPPDVPFKTEPKANGDIKVYFSDY